MSIRKNDFIATYLLQPHISLEEMYANGVTPDNTEIKDFDYYKSNETFQKYFTENGEFNESKAKAFYDGMYEMFNIYAEDDYSKKALEVIESSPRDWINLDSKKYDPSAKIIVNNLPNRSTQGMSTTPVARFTDSEIAQANYVRDENGKILDWKPNEQGGLWKGIFRDPMALAIYEEDGFHDENGMRVYHQKGEVKRDENGNPFYQLIGSNSTIGKDILKYTDTITKEGAWINDYDFLDSDGYKKSISGTIVKTAFQIAPYFFSKTRALYGGLTAAKELATVMPVFLNSINSVITGDDENEFGQKMNTWSNRMQTYKPGMTVDGRENFMSFENIGNMVASSVGQLYQQRMIGKIPSLFSKNPNSKAVHNLSASYMALTSAQDSYDSFKEAGATDRVAGLGALASFSAMFGLMKTDYFGGWLTKDTIAEVKSVGKQTAQEFAETVVPQIYRDATGSVTPTVAKKLFGKYYDKINKVMRDVMTAGKSSPVMGVGEQFLRRSLNEAVEETTEEITFDAVKGIFGGIESLFDIKLSEDQYARLDFNWSLEDALKRYAAAFIGGAIGGAVFEGVNQLELIKNPKARAFTEKDVTRRLLYIYASGQGKDADEEFERLYKKGKLGNANLSAYKRRTVKGIDGDDVEIFDVGTEKDNQNLAVYQAIKTEIQNIKHFLKSNRWIASNKELQRKMIEIATKAYDAGESIQQYMERTGESPIIETIVKGNFLSFASKDIYEEMFNVYDMEQDIIKRKNEIRATVQNEEEYEKAIKDDDELKYLEQRVKEQKQLVNDILGGKYADYYIEYGMFAADDIAKDRMISGKDKILETVETYVKLVHGEDYEKLNEEQKFLYKKEWETFKDSKPEKQMKNLFHLFRAVNEQVSKTSLEGFSTNPVSDELFEQSMYRDTEEITKLQNEISELQVKLQNNGDPTSEEYKEIFLQFVQKQAHLSFINDVFSEALTEKGRAFVDELLKNGYNELEYRRHLIDAYNYTKKENETLANELEQSGNAEDLVEAAKLRVNAALIDAEIEKLNNETTEVSVEPLIQALKQYHGDIISKGIVRSNDSIAKLIVQRVVELSFSSIFGVNYDQKKSIEEIIKKYLDLLGLQVDGGLDTSGWNSTMIRGAIYDFITNIQNDPLNIEKYFKSLKETLSKLWDANIDSVDEESKWMFDPNFALTVLFGTKEEIETMLSDWDPDKVAEFEENWISLPIGSLIDELLQIAIDTKHEETTPVEKIVQDLFVQIDGRPSEWIKIIAAQVATAKALPEEYKITEDVRKHLDEINVLLDLVINALDAASNGYNAEANVYRNALKHNPLLEITDDQAAVYKDELMRWKNTINVLRHMAEFNKETAEKHQTEITLNMDSIYTKYLTQGRIAEKLKELGIDTEDLWKKTIGDETIDFGKIEESEYEHFGELVLSFRQKLYEAFKARTSTIIDKSEIEEFYDKLIDCFGDDLWMGLNGELSSDPEYEPTNNQMLSHFLGIVGQDQNQFGSLWKYVVESSEYKDKNGNPFVPFSSQLESIRDAMSLILNPTLYNRVNDAIYRIQRKQTDEYVKQRPAVNNLIVLLGGPGSGKSSAVGRAIRLMVNALGGDVVLSASTQTQLDNLATNVDGKLAHSARIKLDLLLQEIGFDFSKHVVKKTDEHVVGPDEASKWITLSESFKTKGFKRFDPEAKPKVLIIDEFTYLNSAEIQALCKTAIEEGFTIIGLGDDAQNSLDVTIEETDDKGNKTTDSIPSEIHDVLVHTTPYLTVSMRANNQAQYMNACTLGKVMRAALTDYKSDRTKSSGDIVVEQNVTLYFSEHDGDIFGIKNDIKTANDAPSAIKEYIERFSSNSEKTILVIVDKPSDYSSYASDKVIIVTPKDAQSLEADYVIIQESPQSNQFKRARNFNTLVTRAKQATIYISGAKPDGFEFEFSETGYTPASQLGSEESREKHKALIMSPYKMDPYTAKESKDGKTQSPPPPSSSTGSTEAPPIIEQQGFEIDDEISIDGIIERYDNRQEKEKLHDWKHYDRRKEIESSGNPKLSHEKYINWLFGNIGKRWISSNEMSPFTYLKLNTDAANNAIRHIINCLSVYRLEANNFADFERICGDFISKQLSEIPTEKHREVVNIIKEIIKSDGIYYVKGGILYYVYNSNGNYKAIPISRVENIDDGAYSADTKFKYETTLVGLSTEGSRFTKTSEYKQDGVYFTTGKVYISKSGEWDSDDGHTYVNASHIPWIQKLTGDNDKDKTDSNLREHISRIGTQDIMKFEELWDLLELSLEYINTGKLDSGNGERDFHGNALKRMSEILGIPVDEIDSLREIFASLDRGEQLEGDHNFVERLKKLDVLSDAAVYTLTTALFEFIRSDSGKKYQSDFYEAISKYTTASGTLGVDRLNCFDISIKSDRWWPRRFVFRYINQDTTNGTVTFEVREMDKRSHDLGDPTTITIEKNDIDWWNWDFLEKLFANPEFKHLISTQENFNSGEWVEVESATSWAANLDLDQIKAHVDGKNIQIGFGSIQKFTEENITPRYWPLTSYGFTKLFKRVLSEEDEKTSLINDFSNFINSSSKFKHGIYTNIKGIDYVSEESSYKSISDSQDKRLQMDIHSFLLPFYSITGDRLITDDSLSKDTLEYLDTTLKTELSSEDLDSDEDVVVGTWTYNNGVVTFKNGQVNKAFIEKYVLDFPFDSSVNEYVISKISGQSIEINGVEYELKDPSIIDNFKSKVPGIFNSDGTVEFKINGSKVNAIVGKEIHECAVLSMDNRETIVFDLKTQQLYVINKRLNVNPIDDRQYLGVLRETLADGSQAVRVVYETQTPFKYVVHSPGTTFGPSEYNYLGGSWYEGDIPLTVVFEGSIPESLPNTSSLSLGENGDVLGGELKLLIETASKLLDINTNLGITSVNIINLNPNKKTATIEVGGSKIEVDWKDGISIKHFGFSSSQTNKFINIVNSFKKVVSDLQQENPQFAELEIKLPTNSREIDDCLMLLNEQCKQKEREWGYGYEFTRKGSKILYKPIVGEKQKISKLLYDKQIDFKDFVIEIISNTAEILVTLQNGETIRYRVSKDNGSWKNIEVVTDNVEVFNQLEIAILNIDSDPDPDSSLGMILEKVKNRTATFENVCALWPTQPIPLDILELIQQLPNCDL